MKTAELKENEMKQVSGGNFFTDLEEYLRKMHKDETTRIGGPKPPETWTGRGKC